MSKRKLLVTSALPYANGSIHLGHLVEHIQTDIFVRFQKLIGNTCHYMCADDAHGTAIMLSAKKQGVSPEEYIKAIREEHIADFKAFHIDHDHYHTTHSAENQQLSEDIYLKAKAAGAIKEADIEQYFCEQTNLFLADRYIKGTCPKCDATDQYGDACEKCFATYDATELKNPVSVYSGKAPILKSSRHYFFDLAQFEQVITQWLAQDHVIDSVKNKLKEWLDQGLKRWDISRDAPYFGFTIPGTTDKYFYVWLDAPVGYIATTQSWCNQTNLLSLDDIWRSNDYEIHHFIGKDILYFHTLFWPAMLSVANYQLPKKVHVHGFLTVNGEKMSKSRGTFILAKTYAEHLNPEFLRYYYASKLTPSMDDIDLNFADFMHKINSDVCGKVINIASRLGSIVHKRCSGKLTDIPASADTLLASIQSKKDTIQALYENLEFNKAMKEIMACADLANQYIDQQAPWAIAKENPKAAADICTAGINACRLLMIYLKPVIPKIVEQFEEFIQSKPMYWLDLNQLVTNQDILAYKHLASRLDKIPDQIIASSS